MEDNLIKTLSLLLFSGLLMGISAYAAPLSQCPAVGNDTQGCELLITVTASSGGAATAFTVSTASPDQGPYDGSDDTLVGILNSSSSTLTTIALSGSTDIFGFDGDGACTYIACAGATDPSGYAPAGVTFSGVNAAQTSGSVDFNPGLAPGASGWFSLEEALTASDITPGSGSAPEPSSLLLMGVGFTAIAASLRRRLKAK